MALTTAKPTEPAEPTTAKDAHAPDGAGPRGRGALRARRRELCFTQESIAEQLGVAASTCRLWELGKSRPLVGLRPRLAAVLQVSLAEIRAWFEDDPRDAGTER